MDLDKKQLKSIKEVISFLHDSQEYLFYVGRIYCNSPLDLHPFLPKFEIITCFDPFNQRFPFVKVPQSFKNHKCAPTATQCQSLLLKDPEVIEYMKSKSLKPNVFFMMFDAECQRLCNENQLNHWGPRYQIYSLLGSKVKIIQILEKINIPFIPNICSTINNYAHFLELIKPFNTDKIVVQTQHGASGMGTFFIFNEQSYNKNSSLFENGVMNKIMAYKKLKSFGISAVACKFGTVIGPIHAEVIGHPKLTPYPLGFCANEQRNDYFEDKQIQREVRHKMYDITRRFGNYLYKQGIFRGMFGIDFVVDVQTYEVYFMEINPRLTGSTTISYQFYQAQGLQFPTLLFHCLEYMNISVQLDIQSYNRQWEQLKHYDPPATHIAIKPFSQMERSLSFNIPAGLWKIDGAELKFTGKFTYKVKQMGDDQFFLLPNHGFSKANIIMKKKCQDFYCKLTVQIEQIIDKVLQLINNSNQ